MSLMAPLLAMLEGLCGWQRGDLFQQPSMGEEGLRRLLRGVEDRYGGASAELGPGALQDLKRNNVFEFCRFYARWLGSPLMERLRHEIYELLEEAIVWWGRQSILDVVGR